MPQFQRIAQHPNCFIGLHENVVLLYWTDVASSAAVADVRSVFSRLKAQRQPILFLTYMEERTLSRETPTDFRKAMASLLTDFGDDIKAGAVVFEKPGFKGAMLRAIVSAIGLASRSRFPSSVHANLREAVDWLLKTADADPARGAALEEAIHEALERARTRKVA